MLTGSGFVGMHKVYCGPVCVAHKDEYWQLYQMGLTLVLLENTWQRRWEMQMRLAKQQFDVPEHDVKQPFLSLHQQMYVK